jgi:hypothetical protein
METTGPLGVIKFMLPEMNRLWGCGATPPRYGTGYFEVFQKVSVQLGFSYKYVMI